MRVGNLIFAVLGMCACGGKEMSAPNTAPPPTPETSTTSGGEAISTTGGGGAGGEITPTGDGCAGVDMVYNACECNRRGLVGTRLTCCLSQKDCPLDSQGQDDCLPEFLPGYVGTACDWKPMDAGGATAELTCDSASLPSARYCKYPDAIDNPEATLASCVNGKWQMLRIPCPVQVDDGVYPPPWYLGGREAGDADASSE